MLMSKSLDIFIFVPDVISTVFIPLNSILKLSSNKGGAILLHEKLEIILRDKPS